MDTKNISEFYDDFVVTQQESGINDRIYTLYKRLLHLGLKSTSNVLELGCGIGAMTFLLSKSIKAGQIEAIDLSGESIQFAKQRLKKPNITFFAGDVVSHRPSIKNIDFITLFDVIEHIPMDRHNELFRNLSTICNENTKILINIPSPGSIEYDMKNNPDTLQIIDQPLPLKFIVQNLENNGLEIIHFETYDIWVEGDYQFFVITQKRAYKEIKLSDKRSLIQKAIKKMERHFIKLKYNYP